MKTVNSVTLLGAVGKEPDVRSTPSGTTVAGFSLATTERYKNNKGEWQEKTTWHNCSSFGKLADVVKQYVHRGSKLYIEGRIDEDIWKDKQTGQDRRQTKIVVNDLVLLDSKQEEPQNNDVSFDEPFA